ncbi:DnaJ domain-containing protein [Chloroflexota bacterium]
MASYSEIDSARKLIGLGEEASSKQIRSAYRTTSFRYHPDTPKGVGSPEHEETTKRLNWAYKLLLQYCHDYKYSFREKDIGRTYPHEEYMRKWHENWFNSI